MAGQLGSQPEPEPAQQSAQPPERSGSESKPRQGLEGDGPETQPAAKASPFAARSLSPPPADDWGSSGRRSSVAAKTRKANRYDMLLGD